MQTNFSLFLFVSFVVDWNLISMQAKINNFRGENEMIKLLEYLHLQVWYEITAFCQSHYPGLLGGFGQQMSRRSLIDAVMASLRHSSCHFSGFLKAGLSGIWPTFCLWREKQTSVQKTVMKENGSTTLWSDCFNQNCWVETFGRPATGSH